MTCYMPVYRRRNQMKARRKYHIIIGSQTFFDINLPEYFQDDEVKSFMELVRLSDAAKESGTIFKQRAKKIIIKNNHYHGIVEAAHDRLGSLIEELTQEDATIYVHNPPRILRQYIENQYGRSLIELNVKCEEYNVIYNSVEFAEIISDISSQIIGQQTAIKEISKSLWYLTTIKRKKPYVIMLYGNSSLGKTELVRMIAEHFFEGKYLEKHLSMFKNNNYSDYFFGDAPNRRSLGYDLLERESNLVFFDELDKCPEHFYSAFYTLFDNVTFKDSTYDVDVSGTVIILTSNYHSKEEMKQQLGLPIFYRIDKFIHFEDFTCSTIYSLVKKEIIERKAEYETKLTPEMVYAAVSPIISSSGENARTIKYKVQSVIEELLFQDVESIIE